MSIKISDHAIARFQERIRAVPSEHAEEEMRHCLCAAKDKHFKRLKKNRNTVIIPTGCCIFVLNGITKRVVTVLERPGD